jgi:poly-D-alanine transfer protein DltD
LQALAEDSALGKIKYVLAWPLGKLQILVITIQDHYAVWDFVRHQSAEKLKVTRKESTIDWDADIAKAGEMQMERSNGNTYGVDNDRWARGADLMANLPPAGSKDERFIENVKVALEWRDMQILLRIVKELDGHPLMLGRPMNVGLWEALGYSEEAQDTYYQMLHQTVDPFGYPVIDF